MPTILAVLAVLQGDSLRIALSRRQDRDAPEFGKLELPGVVFQPGEFDFGTALCRGMEPLLGFSPSYVEQAAAVPGADFALAPRVVYLALHPAEALEPLVKTGQIELIEVMPSRMLPEDLAYDHDKLIAEGLALLGAKAGYSTLVGHLLPPVFKLADLLRAYEVVCQKSLNPANFRRKVVLESDVLAEAGVLRGQGRPAQGYRLKNSIAYFKNRITG